MNKDTVLIENTIEDLRYLAGTWNANVDDHVLRRSSTTVRLLLVEGMLQRAWRSAGFDKEPFVLAPRLECFLESAGGTRIVAAVAGGGNYAGMDSAFAMVNEGNEAVAPEPNVDPLAFRFTLRGFVNSCGIFAERQRISRREIIKYVANKLGSAHYDTRRDDSISAVLSRVSRQFDLFGKDAVYFELLSTGQHVAKSPDVQRLIALA